MNDKEFENLLAKADRQMFISDVLFGIVVGVASIVIIWGVLA